MSAELWNDGQLKSVTLETNAFPEGYVAELPDEVFLETGDERVEIIKEVTKLGGAYWSVNSPPYGNGCPLFTEFGEAFAHALMLVRKAVEEGEVA